MAPQREMTTQHRVSPPAIGTTPITSMTSIYFAAILLLSSACVVPIASAASATMPAEYTVTQKGMECLYEKFSPKESATMSVFINSGSELRGTLVFEGPVAPPTAETGSEIQAAVLNYQSQRPGSHYGKTGNIKEETVVDFEEEFDDDADYDDDDIYDDDDDDDDYAHSEDFEEGGVLVEKGPTAGQTAAAKARRARRVVDKNKRKEDRKRKREARMKLPRPTEADAWQRTFEIQVEGWYRACVKASWTQVSRTAVWVEGDCAGAGSLIKVFGVGRFPLEMRRDRPPSSKPPSLIFSQG